jgi:plasmid stability protein
VRNITVSVDDETYRRARIRAAENDTSVSAMVRAFLDGIASEPRKSGEGASPALSPHSAAFRKLAARQAKSGGGLGSLAVQNRRTNENRIKRPPKD